MNYESRQTFGVAAIGGRLTAPAVVETNLFVITWGENISPLSIRGVKHISLPSTVDAVFTAQSAQEALEQQVALPTGFGVAQSADSGKYYYYINAGFPLGSTLPWGSVVIVEGFTKIPVSGSPENIITFASGIGWG